MIENRAGFFSNIRSYLPSSQTIINTVKGATNSIPYKALHTAFVPYARFAGDAFFVSELVNFFDPKKAEEEEASWTDYVGMGLAVVSSTYLMLTVYNIKRKQASSHQALETPSGEHQHGMVKEAIEAASIFIPTALLGYGASISFMRKMITTNPIAVQAVSAAAGLFLGIDNYVFHESHHNAEQGVGHHYQRLTRAAKVWFFIRAISSVVGHGMEAFLQSDAGLRVILSANSLIASYFRLAGSIIISMPVIYFASKTELHSILVYESTKHSISLLVRSLGYVASIVHTLGPAVGSLEFASLLNCLIDGINAGGEFSPADLTPECETSFIHELSWWVKILPLVGAVIGVGLMGGKGFQDATMPDVNEVAEDAANTVKNFKLSEFRICHWNKNRDDQVALATSNTENYGTSVEVTIAQ